MNETNDRNAGRRDEDEDSVTEPIDIVRLVAERNPNVSSGTDDGDKVCFWCHTWYFEKHEDDCVWLVARRMVGLDADVWERHSDEIRR